MEQRSKKRETMIFGAVLIILGAALILSICVGKYAISLSEIWRLLTNGAVDDMTRSVFFTLRLSRTLMALIAGLGLGMAGSVYQTIFKNPLAAPEIIGVSQGANLGAAIAIVILGNVTSMVTLGAFFGALLSLGLVMLLVYATKTNTTATYVLSGIVISAMAQACIMTLKFFADPEKELAAIEFWSMGSLGSITMEKFLTVLPIFALGMLGMVLLRRQISLLSLNEDESRTLGVRVGTMRIAVLGCSTLCVSAIISVTGLISFVGLIAPHMARLALKHGGFKASVLAALIGACVLILADCAARVLYSAELPISILTTLVGVPFLVYFMCNKKTGRV